MNGAWATGHQRDTFRFTAAPFPPGRFSFSRPSSPRFSEPRRPKRARPLTDVDGEGSNGTQKKKRRLRLVFITSRLSQPFSSPPTHIVSRGSSKIAVWAKQKALGRSLLRKAAIMNRVRKHVVAAREREPERSNAIKELFMFFSRRDTELPTPESTSASTNAAEFQHCAKGPKPTEELPLSDARSPPQNQHLPLPPDLPFNPPSPPPSPRRQYIPLPPSPLHLTNYDVFDNEDGYFDSDSDAESDCNEEWGSRVYSDFNILEPSEPVVEDHDSISAFDSLSFSSQWLLPNEILKEDEKATEILREKERQKEVSFIHFGF